MALSYVSMPSWEEEQSPNACRSTDVQEAGGRLGVEQPTHEELEEARRQFERLLTGPSSEKDFQGLFTRCPYLLSRSLPLRVESHDIRPLGRPGRSEPDFVFYPRETSVISSFGVIELKRPDTRLITEPRKGLIILTRDTTTAITQATVYARDLERELVSRFRTNVIVGNRSYLFIIAGLTNELASKSRSDTGTAQLQDLVPPGCHIIPYDELLARYEATLPRQAIILTPLPVKPAGGPSLLQIVREIDAAGNARFDVNDANMDFWARIENQWRATGALGSRRPRIIDRKYWCIFGTDQLATESPAHLMFPAYVETLIRSIRQSAEMHDTLDTVERHGLVPTQLEEMLTSKQFSILREAVERCRSTRLRSTWIFPIDENVDFLEKLGLIRLQNVDSGEFYYAIDPVMFEVIK